MALFTAENAAEMAKRSWAARKQHEEDLRKAANPVPLPADNSYVERRLARAREQIEMLSEMLENESDPIKLDRLASALGRLSEIERQLANRPLPGSWKPSISPKSTRRTLAEPTVPACMPDTPIPSVPQPAPSPGTPQDTQEPKQ